MNIPTGRIWQCHQCGHVNSYDNGEIYCRGYGCGKPFQPKIDDTNDDVVRTIIEVRRMASKKTMDSNLLPPL